MARGSGWSASYNQSAKSRRARYAKGGIITDFGSLPL